MKVFAAMSGGVDSAVAALLLQRAGHEVVGIHLRTGVKADGAAPTSRPRCCGADEAADARRVCALLDIPFYVQNTEAEFGGLIRAFADAYARGETPNPCVACNTDIKFGALLDRARALGMDAVATGHYARRVRHGDRWAVARARDAGKDQSYVLYGLGQDELARTLFPLGELEKGEVRELAREAGLPVADKAESQEICFVPTGDYRDVVRPMRPAAFEPGEIVDHAGTVLGEHGGVGGFTVGQRKGLGLATEEPLFVVGIRPEQRRVVVAPRAELGVSTAALEETAWTAIAEPREPRRVEVSLRYRAAPVAATVEAKGGGAAELRFEEPAWPVTPGQAAVMYEKDVVLGGGRLRACS
jgi:tRNA-specific 2-thiouridylase